MPIYRPIDEYYLPTTNVQWLPISTHTNNKNKPVVRWVPIDNKESFFSRCERDAKGHCMSAGDLIDKIKEGKGKKVTAKEAKSLAESLSRLSTKELATLKKEHGLKATGKKAELVEKLAQALREKIDTEKKGGGKEAKGKASGKPAPSDKPTASGKEAAAYTKAMKEGNKEGLDKTLGKMTVAKLNELAKANGVTVSGLKGDKVKQLVDAVKSKDDKKEATKEQAKQDDKAKEGKSNPDKRSQSQAKKSSNPDVELDDVNRVGKDPKKIAEKVQQSYNTLPEGVKDLLRDHDYEINSGKNEDMAAYGARKGAGGNCRMDAKQINVFTEYSTGETLKHEVGHAIDSIFGKEAKGKLEKDKLAGGRISSAAKDQISHFGMGETDAENHPDSLAAAIAKDQAKLSDDYKKRYEYFLTGAAGKFGKTTRGRREEEIFAQHYSFLTTNESDSFRFDKKMYAKNFPSSLAWMQKQISQRGMT